MFRSQRYLPFKARHSLEKRRREARNIIAKYPDRIPIICEVSGREAPELDKKKYLVPRDLSMGQFLYIIRKRMSLPAEKAIYMFVNNKLLTGNALVSTTYDEERDDDGFLYITYSGETTFGSK